MGQPVRIFLLSLLCSSVCLSQTPPKIAPVPADPYELVKGPAQVLRTPEQRAAILGLLDRARQNYNFYAADGPAYSLKVSFVSSGQTAHEGSGSMEDTRLGPTQYRWTAQVGGSSHTRIFSNGQAWARDPNAPIPLRIQQVRGAILWPVGGISPKAAIRSAAAYWNGAPVTCVLSARTSAGVETLASRRWEEIEYCLEPKSGLLEIWSEAPGIYVAYDYKDALQFEGHTLARQISVFEAGRPVLQIHLDTIEEPRGMDPGFFQPTPEMLAQGPSFALWMEAARFLVRSTPASGIVNPVIQPVIVHVTLDHRDGKVVEAEVLQNSNPELSQAAIELVRQKAFPMPGGQREAFIRTDFYAGQ